MLFLSLQIVLSFVFLLLSAEKFVEGAASSARLLKVPPFLIGLFILGFGTSAPEILVSILSALKGSPGVALGNAYGSNIANIGLVLGMTALIKPLTVASKTLGQEMRFLVFITLLTPILLWDCFLGFFDALVLLSLFGLFVIWALWKGAKDAKIPQDPYVQDVQADVSQGVRSAPQAFFSLLGGGIVLILSSKYLVDAAVEIARLLHVSDLVIGLTLVAIGTSLPELFASLVAIKKNEHALAFGNVVGSNLLNTLVVVGVAGVIKSFEADQSVLSRDLPLMTGMTLVLVLARFFPKTASEIGRFEGAFYLILYLAYLVYLATGVSSPS